MYATSVAAVGPTEVGGWYSVQDLQHYSQQHALAACCAKGPVEDNTRGHAQPTNVRAPGCEENIQQTTTKVLLV